MINIEEINKVKEIFSKDELANELVKQTFDDMGYYVDVVNRMEHMGMARFRMEHEEYVELVTDLDMKRRTCHNTIISGVKTINRMLKEINQDILYKGDEDDRYAIADFACEVVNEVFKNRKK